MTPVHVPDDDYKQYLQVSYLSHLYIIPNRYNFFATHHCSQHLKHTEALVVCVVDVFDFPGSLYHDLHTLIGNNKVLLAVNKIDVLPIDPKVIA